MTSQANDGQPLDAEGAAAAEPHPVDPAKVDRLRRRIAAGTYAVDPDAVAAALLATGSLTVGDKD